MLRFRLSTYSARVRRNVTLILLATPFLVSEPRYSLTETFDLLPSLSFRDMDRFAEFL